MTKNTIGTTGSDNGSLPTARRESIVTPCADIYETPDTYVLLLDLPGASRESIALSLANGVLEVKADVGRVRDEQATTLCNEIRTSGYSRTFAIGEGIDVNNVDARFEDGVLTVKFFKREEQKPREITIN